MDEGEKKATTDVFPPSTAVNTVQEGSCAQLTTMEKVPDAANDWAISSMESAPQQTV